MAGKTAKPRPGDWIAATDLGLSFGLATWIYVFRWPFWTLMTVAFVLPFLALAADGLLRLTLPFAGLRPSQRPWFIFSCIVPPFCVFLGMLQYRFLDGVAREGDIFFAIMALLVVLAIARRYLFPKRGKANEALGWIMLALLTIGLAAMHVAGTIRMVDVAFDNSTAVVYRATIAGKHAERPYRRAAHYYLDLNAWGRDRKPVARKCLRNSTTA